MNFLGISNDTKMRMLGIRPCAKTTLFSAEECDKICEIFSKREKTKGVVSNGKDSFEDNERRSNVIFSSKDNELAWVFDKINNVTSYINATEFNFDLNGYDSVQYTEYNSSYEGKYDWHMDTLISNSLPSVNELYYEPRKLSLTIALNSSLEFSGGEFQLQTKNEPSTIPLEKGEVIFFPSFLLHRVTTVTEGIRKSLVVWVTGPKFK